VAKRLAPQTANFDLKCIKTIFRAARRDGYLLENPAEFVDIGLREALSRRRTKNGRNTRRASNELSFHCLRHTAVTVLKDAGIPEAVVMELVGHDSKQMSAHYTHVGQEALEKATAALPAL
jgi:integrase